MSGNSLRSCFRLLRITWAGVEHVGQRAAGVANGCQDLPDAAAAAVLNDEAGAGGEVGFEVCVDPAGIAGADVDARVMEPARQRPAFDQEVHLEARHEHVVEAAYDEFVLADGENAHA